MNPHSATPLVPAEDCMSPPTTAAEARRRCWLMDSKGLIVKGRDRLKPHSLPFAHEHDEVVGIANAVESLRPNVIIGATGQRGIFDCEVIKAMSRANERPVVFSLSNPTSRSEATAEEVYGWSEGRAVFAGGSPFDSNVQTRLREPRRGVIMTKFSRLSGSTS